MIQKEIDYLEDKIHPLRMEHKRLSTSFSKLNALLSIIIMFGAIYSIGYVVGFFMDCI